MPDEVRLCRIGPDDNLDEMGRTSLDLEARLQEWLARDISDLDPELLVIGRKVETDFGGYIDLLCIDAAGDLVVIELKRDRTPREITAQVLDYGSWVADLPHARVTSIADGYLGQKGFDQTFRDRFGTDVPETLNSDHRLLVLGSRIDPSTERIVKYLSDRRGVNINAATFQYFRTSARPIGQNPWRACFSSSPPQWSCRAAPRGPQSAVPISPPKNWRGLPRRPAFRISTATRWRPSSTA
jgi:hypothetical protein